MIKVAEGHHMDDSCEYGQKWAVVIAEANDIPTPEEGFRDYGEPYTDEEIDTILEDKAISASEFIVYYNGPGASFANHPSVTCIGDTYLVTQTVGLDI